MHLKSIDWELNVQIKFICLFEDVDPMRNLLFLSSLFSAMPFRMFYSTTHIMVKCLTAMILCKYLPDGNSTFDCWGMQQLAPVLCHVDNFSRGHVPAPDLASWSRVLLFLLFFHLYMKPQSRHPSFGYGMSLNLLQCGLITCSFLSSPTSVSLGCLYTFLSRFLCFIVYMLLSSFHWLKVKTCTFEGYELWDCCLVSRILKSVNHLKWRQF